MTYVSKPHARPTVKYAKNQPRLPNAGELGLDCPQSPGLALSKPRTPKNGRLSSVSEQVIGCCQPAPQQGRLLFKPLQLLPEPLDPLALAL